MPADTDQLSKLLKPGLSPAFISGITSFLSPEQTTFVKKHKEERRENGLKNFFKRWPRFYDGVVFFIGPTFFTGLTSKRFVKKYRIDGLLLHAGSGTRVLDVPSVNVDVFPFPGVDVLADLAALPFKNGTFGAVTCDQVLEHVSEPKRVADEFMRIVKSGGLIHVATPFVFPWHASPSDFTRWTQEGLAMLFPNCEVVERGITGGPCSAAVAFLSAFFATILCLGSKTLQGALQYLFLILLAPLKFLDLLFARVRGAELVAANCYVVMRKP